MIAKSPLHPILVAAAVLFGLAIHAPVHQTGSGWSYPPACCKGDAVGATASASPIPTSRKGRMDFRSCSILATIIW
jgi:hypothetical protein